MSEDKVDREPTPPIAAVNIYGPDGELVVAGDPVPDHWEPDYVDDLMASGGAYPIVHSSIRPGHEKWDESRGR